MIGIYKYTNKINGKIYIGQSVNIYKRKNYHEAPNSRKLERSYFHRAIDKYGIENFDFEIVEECSKEELNEKEKLYIEKYNSFDRNNGYNRTTGGEQPNRNSLCKPVYQIDMKTRKIVSQFVSTREAERKTNVPSTHIIGCCQRKTTKAKGFLWSYVEDYDEDYYRNLDIKQGGRKQKMVYQKDVNSNIVGCYENIKIASNLTKIGRTSINNCLCGYSKTAGGYLWSY